MKYNQTVCLLLAKKPQAPTFVCNDPQIYVFFLLFLDTKTAVCSPSHNITEVTPSL